MSRTVRMWVLGVGLAGVALLLVLAAVDMPQFGSTFHPYRDLAVPAAVDHGTANVVMAVTFDQRGLDTLGEELIFFGSVLAVTVLLRPGQDEHLRSRTGRRPPLEVTRLFGYLLLPLTLVVGLDVVLHGHVTPGGGFQGGVVLATGLHLLYVAGDHRALQRLRPDPLFEYGEAAGAAGYVVLGLGTLAATGAFLANVLPYGQFGQLLSAGTVPVLDATVGVAVGSGAVVLLSQFLRQIALVTDGGDTDDERAEASS